MRHVRIAIDMRSNVCSTFHVKNDIQSVLSAIGWDSKFSSNLAPWMEFEKGRQELLYCEPPRISGTVLEEEVDLILQSLGTLSCIRIHNIDIASSIAVSDTELYHPSLKAYRKEIREDLLLAFTTGNTSEYIGMEKPIYNICAIHGPYISTRIATLTTEQIVREEFQSLLRKKKILSNKSAGNPVFHTEKYCEILPSANICRAVEELHNFHAQTKQNKKAVSFKLMAGALRMEPCTRARKWASVTDKAVDCIWNGALCDTFAEARALWVRCVNGHEAAA